MKQKFTGANSLIPVQNATRYCSISGPNLVLNAVESRLSCPIIAGTLRKLYAVASVDPTGSETVTLTVMVAGVASALTVSLGTGNFAGASDTTHNVSVTAGQLVSMRIVGSTSAVVGRVSFILEFEPTATGTCVLLGGNEAAGLGTGTTTQFQSVSGSLAANTTEAQSFIIMPCAGTFTALITSLSAAPGGSATRTAQVRLTTGANAGTTANAGDSIAYASGESGVKSVTFGTPVTVAAGDRVDISWAVGGSGSPVTGFATCCLTFVPTTDGQFPLAAWTTNTLTATRYIGLDSGAVAQSTEALAQTVVSADFSLLGLTAWLDGTPGVSPRKFTFSLRRNGADASTTFATDLSTQGPTSSSTLTYAVQSDYDLLNSIVVQTSAPNAVKALISYVATMVSAPTNNRRRFVIVQSSTLPLALLSPLAWIIKRRMKLMKH